MYACPRCDTRLVRQKSLQELEFVCPQRHGVAITLPTLRRRSGRETASQVWNHAGDSEHPAESKCPACRRSMSQVIVPCGDDLIWMDVCQRCHFIWFESGELDKLPNAKTTTVEPSARDMEAIQRHIPENVREKIAVAEMKLEGTKGKDADVDREMPDNAWQWLPGLIGLPVEYDVDPVRSLPWVTWGLAAILGVVFLVTATDIRGAADSFGMIPAEATRYLGLTLITSFFLHGGIWHLIGNTYFLLVFGDNVEDTIGRWRYVGLLLIATIVGDLFHIFGETNSNIPCIGASGGISGVLVFYALQFPNARLGVFIWHFRGGWFSFPAYLGLVFWVALQLLITYQQVILFSSVSGLAHLGGAATGFVLWIVWRKKKTDELTM